MRQINRAFPSWEGQGVGQTPFESRHAAHPPPAPPKRGMIFAMRKSCLITLTLSMISSLKKPKPDGAFEVETFEILKISKI